MISEAHAADNICHDGEALEITANLLHKLVWNVPNQERVIQQPRETLRHCFY